MVNSGKEQDSMLTFAGLELERLHGADGGALEHFGSDTVFTTVCAGTGR
jgi:hypothetical protein